MIPTEITSNFKELSNKSQITSAVEWLNALQIECRKAATAVCELFFFFDLPKESTL